MLNKTKKVAFLTTGLAGALVVSSAVGIALSSCTTNNTSSSNKPNKYTYSIDWTDQDQIRQLTIDEQGLVYSSADKTEIITVAPNTATTSFVIPASVKYITGYNLITKNSSGTITSSVSYGAFQGQTSLISVTFASNDTLISIGDSAFKGCTYLSTFTLPTSTTVVYNSAFENCTNLRNIGLSNVTYIGSSAFKNAIANGAYISVDLSSATYIGDSAFEGSVNLVNVDLSNNTTLTYIGKSAFKDSLSNGDSAATINLSKAAVLKTISDGAFQNCTNLAFVSLPTTSVLTTIGANAFNGATSLTQVGATANTFTAPASLGNYAATTATSAVPSYVTSGIGANAFAGTKIAKVDLSALTVTTPLGNAAFKNMTSLDSINFGSSSKITTIPYSLFEGDTALTTLTLPASITTINDGNNNDNSAAAYVDQKSPFYNSGLVNIDMSNITSYATGTTTWNAVTINNTTMVPVKLFQGLTSLKSVALKTGTVVIGESAFNGTTSLATVKENSASSIADETSGDGFVISSTLEMINTNAFNGSGIKKVAFANESTESATNNLWFLGQGAFRNATALTTVNLSKANTTTSHTINISAYSGASSSESSNGAGLYSISANAFNGATALTSIQLPASIATIYSNAFVDNTNLSSVNFSALTNLSNILTGNFNNASSLTEIDLSKSTVTTFPAIIASATNIFTGLSTDATVTLPSSTTSLANSSFLVGEATVANLSNRPNITYGGTTGLNLNLNRSSGLTIAGVANQAVGALGIGSSSSTSSTSYLNPMLQYISGSYDLTKSLNVLSTTNNNVASGADIAYYYPWTFFGNTKLTSLTMSVSKFALNGTTSVPTQATKLFFNNVSSAGQAADYLYNKVPFGNNSALKSFTFTNFDVNSDPTYPSVLRETANNPLYKTTAKTWAQVATIINKFASNNVTTITAWPSVSGNNQDAVSRVNSDSVVSGAQGTGADTNKYTVKFTNVNQTVSDTDQSESNNVSASFNASFDNVLSNASGDAGALSSIFYHNGVKWILTVYSSDHATNPGAVTLVGENINVYKGSNDTLALNNQIPFATTTSEGNVTTANKITVTLNIVPSTKTTA